MIIISNKMLEMGILTHIELIDDYNTREPIIGGKI